MKTQEKGWLFRARFAALAMVLLAVVLGAAEAQSPGTAKPDNQKQHFLVLLYPAWSGPAGEARLEPILQDHVEYMRKQFEAGRLILGGPRADGAYGVGVLEAESREEAQRIMEKDPAVRAGAFRLELYPLRLAFVRKAC